ncbi:hypothetical protein B0H19DRAFT_1074018 [Mycena capillaripes]|nr:hypothetical protein B0H19DRAFT_1074018 [Mycena capillaripes]
MHITKGDPSTALQWYAIDVDPCTGEETERDLLLAQPAGNAPIGRTTFRTDGGGGARRRDLEERKGGGGGGGDGGGKGGGGGGGGGGGSGGGGTTIDASSPTREVGFRYTTGTSAGPKGLIAGQFIQPIFFFVFPELISFGANEVPNQFDLMPFLAMGSGPYVPGNYLAEPLESPVRVGQLSPWPGVTVPGTTSCPPFATATASA